MIGSPAGVVDRVVLVGFMCSGKSTVGRQLADRLGWELIDFDEIIERREGRGIAEIFRDEGESYFRSLEAELTETVCDSQRAVIAPGGGWITQPGLIDRLRPRSLIVWLRVRARTVHERHRSQREVQRPLLDVPQPLQAIESLLEERAAHYRTADEVIDTDDRRPSAIVEQILRLVTG